jgi:hypothetical protein
LHAGSRLGEAAERLFGLTRIAVAQDDETAAWDLFGQHALRSTMAPGTVWSSAFIVSRTCSAWRAAQLDGEAVDEHEVVEALQRLDPLWHQLFPLEQARILQLLVERIDVAPDGICLTPHAAGIRRLVAELTRAEGTMLEAAE